jgi:hypothetical protein
VKQLLPSLGSDVVMISIDVDLTEDAARLRRYADQEGWAWRHAMASREMLEALDRAYGARFLTPPADPTLLINTKGEVTAHFGFKDERTLRDLVQRARA